MDASRKHGHLFYRKVDRLRQNEVEEVLKTFGGEATGAARAGGEGQGGNNGDRDQWLSQQRGYSLRQKTVNCESDACGRKKLERLMLGSSKK
jgi:hypothetical protein